MNEKFKRVRQFAHDHPRITSAAAGVAVGAAVTAQMMYNPSKLFHLDLTIDQAKALLEDSKICVVFNNPELHHIIHVNVPQPTP